MSSANINITAETIKEDKWKKYIAKIEFTNLDSVKISDIFKD
jgi:hypothetical protein